MWTWSVLLSLTLHSNLICYKSREKGDASKTREFLPADKQYLMTRGVPCLRRATSLAYTDADEDAERLLSFADPGAANDGGEDWVETHAGRAAGGADAAPTVIDDIPDDDATHEATSGLNNMSISAKPEPADIPDMDDIPDMEEEDLEDGDDATAAPSKPKADSGVIDARWVGLEVARLRGAQSQLIPVRFRWHLATCCKYERTM